MEYSLKVREIQITGDKFRFVVDGEFSYISSLSKPKVILHFFNGAEDRRLPLVIKEFELDEDANLVSFHSDYEYLLDHLFWKSGKSGNDIQMYFNVLYGEYYEEKIPLKIHPRIFEQDQLVYVCSIEKNSLKFTHQPDWAHQLDHFLKVHSGWKVKKLCKKIYYVLSFFLALFLLPWFVFDALLASLGIVEYTGKDQETAVGFRQKFCVHVNARLFYLSHHTISLANARRTVDKWMNDWKAGRLVRAFRRYKKEQPVDPRRISFISVRRTELSGNFAFVYDKMKTDDRLDIQMHLNTKDLSRMTGAEIRRFAFLCATSRVIVLDEFTPHVHCLPIGDDTKVVQLWHACGAFKTFGFTRMGKPKGSPQRTRNHRSYDYVTVSTKNVRICHSEGFGIPTANVVPTGIPRSDVFFDGEYRARTRKRLYEQYPMLQGKKVILFAPTFRGHVKEDAYYPMEKFRIDSFMKAVGEEYALIVKHHPFVTEKHPIPEKYKDRVLDLSCETELNDLLFLTDLIITDYSSLVFEASLLDIPMMFYTFDLKKYIQERDFYFDFETFVPGHFFYTQKRLEQAILEKNFAREKVDAFKRRFFDDFDGHSTDRVVALLYEAMKGQETGSR
ncbi:MAG: CDP-glycerol glycerophosphotransferase family protein [Clostridiales bacterium]|nr:CDP-glycerol glycerophosphotransferase family protein [Clostridiales bacterium]